MRGNAHRTGAIVLAVLGVGVLLTITSQLGDGTYAVAGDAHYLYATARSLAFDGDLDLTNQLRALGDPWGLGRDPARDGWRLPPRELGPALLMVPGLWLHDALDLPSAWAPSLAVVPASLSLGLCFWLCMRLLRAIPPPSAAGADPRVALALAATLGFVVPYYAVGRAGYAHAPDAVAGAALCLALVQRASVLRVGVLLALAVLFRLQNFLWLAWPLLESLREPGPGRLRRPLGIAAWACLGVLPQVWLALAHPGTRDGAIRWGPSFFDLDGYALDVLQVLAGTHGLCSWTPLAGLASFGLLWALRGATPPALRRVAVAATCVLALEVLLVAAVRDPSGGWAFGARRLAGMTGIVCVGLGLAARHPWLHERPRALAGTVLGLAALNVAITALALSGRVSLAP